MRSHGNFVGAFYYTQPYVNAQILFKGRTNAEPIRQDDDSPRPRINLCGLPIVFRNRKRGGWFVACQVFGMVNLPNMPTFMRKSKPYFRCTRIDVDEILTNRDS